MGCSFSKGCKVTLNEENVEQIKTILQNNGKNSKEKGLKIFTNGKEQKLWLDNDELKLDKGKIGYPFNFKINEDILCDLKEKEKKEPSAPPGTDLNSQSKDEESNVFIAPVETKKTEDTEKTEEPEPPMPKTPGGPGGPGGPEGNVLGGAYKKKKSKKSKKPKKKSKKPKKKSKKSKKKSKK